MLNQLTSINTLHVFTLQCDLSEAKGTSNRANLYSLTKSIAQLLRIGTFGPTKG